MRAPQPTKNWPTTVLAGLLTTVLFAQNTRADALESALNMIPADAPVAMVVPSLSGLSLKAATLNEQSMGSAVRHMANLLGTIKQMAGVQEGVNNDGPLVVVATDAAALGENGRADQPPMVVAIPVSDYGAFVSQLGGNGDEAITPLTLGGGSPGFAKKVDSHAVIGPTRQQVEAFQPGHAAALWMARAGRCGSRCLTTSDAVVIINIEALEATLRPHLQSAMDDMTDHLDQTATPAPIHSLVKSVASIYADTANAVLRDTSAVIVGLDLNDQGIGLTFTAQFKPGSPLAKIFTTGQGVDKQLALLPRQDYFTASAMNLQGIDTQVLANTLAARIPDQRGQTQADPMAAVLKHAAALAKQTRGMATIYTTSNGPMMAGGGLFKGVVVYETTDGKAYTKLIQDSFGAIQTLLDNTHQAPLVDPNGPSGRPDFNAPQEQTDIKMQYTPNARQVQGAQVDEYQIQYQLTPGMTQEMGPAAPMAMMMMGNMGQKGYIAARGPYVVMTTTHDVQLVEQALLAIDQKKGFDASGAIDRVRRVGLPPHAVFESYLSIPGIIQSANMFMAMMGQPPIAAPEDLPPIATAASVQDHGVVGRLYIPTTVIRFCQEAVAQAMLGAGGAMGAPDDDMPLDDDAAPDPFQDHRPPPAPF